MRPGTPERMFCDFRHTCLGTTARVGEDSGRRVVRLDCIYFGYLLEVPRMITKVQSWGNSLAVGSARVSVRAISGWRCSPIEVRLGKEGCSWTPAGVASTNVSSELVRTSQRLYLPGEIDTGPARAREAW